MHFSIFIRKNVVTLHSKLKNACVRYAYRIGIRSMKDTLKTEIPV